MYSRYEKQRQIAKRGKRVKGNKRKRDEVIGRLAVSQTDKEKRGMI